MILMLSKHSTVVLSALAFIFVFIFVGQTAQARVDWGLSFGYNWPSGSYRANVNTYDTYDNKIGTERRQGYQADEFIEKGAASVTESPKFDDGVRLAAWATRDGEDYQHGMASAVYYFNIPPTAHSVKIKISYDGEVDEKDSKDAIVGRVWIKRVQAGKDYEKYYPKEETPKGQDKPLYGDTFVLRANKHHETITVSTDNYNIGGVMELHVVAEGKQRVDVKYVEVKAYRSEYRPRVVTRYYSDYAWRPWYDYTYSYFYVGPSYYYGDGFYIRYNYPRYGYYYGSIRRHHNNYLHSYYSRHPRSRHLRRGHVSGENSRHRLNRWTQGHTNARRGFRSNSGRGRRSANVQRSRTRIRQALGNRSRRSLSGGSSRIRGSTGSSIKRRSTSLSRSGRGHGLRQAPSRGSSHSRSRSRSIRGGSSRSRSRSMGHSSSRGRSHGGRRGRSSSRGGSRGRRR